jgi:hypothetical protein
LFSALMVGVLRVNCLLVYLLLKLLLMRKWRMWRLMERFCSSMDTDCGIRMFVKAPSLGVGSHEIIR